MLSVTENDTSTLLSAATGYPVQVPYLSNTGATRDAMDFMLLYTPTYRQVVSNLDLDFLVAINFSPYGKSVLGPGFNTYHGGFFNIGAEASYRDANHFTITYQRFYGNQLSSVIPGNPAYENNSIPSWGQGSGDRNYVAVSIYRSFGLKASQKAK